MSGVNEGAQNVFAICSRQPVLDCLREALPEPDNKVDTAADTDQAQEMTENTAFDLILIEFPGAGMPVSGFLKTIRWSGSPCRQAVVIVLTDEEHLDEAEELLDAGVSRIVNIDSPVERFKAVFSELDQSDFRFPVKAFVRIPGKELGLTGTLMSQTDNVSKSGMLVRVTKDVGMGRQFSFSLTPPGTPKPITGTAEVVRVITGFGDRVTGFASTFMAFDGDGKAQLADFLARQPKKSD